MKSITLSNSDLTFIVDDNDYEAVSKSTWYLEKSNQRYYPRTRLKQKLIRIHRFIMNPPDGMEVDHIDGNPLNNCRDNLRICTRTENLQNRKFKC